MAETGRLQRGIRAGFFMLQWFLNPVMLIGLAGLSLPIIAHLISKRRYDVVYWGAMQFLELSPNARRRLRLEQLLLLLVRMGLVALVAFALARPWTYTGFLGEWASTQARDVVLIVDGSYSMGWQGKSTTPHKQAVRWAHDFLDSLRAGDSVALIDARDQARVVIESPTRDLSLVRKQLGDLPSPSGTSNLAEAIRKAVQILARTGNLSREIVVVTDGQARGWKAGDESLWTQVDDLMQQPAVRPRTWVVRLSASNGARPGGGDVQADASGSPPRSQAEPGNEPSGTRTNFSVETLQLSREMTAVNYPIRVKTKVRLTGGKESYTRHVHLEIDGQRIAERRKTVVLTPGTDGAGEASVEFELRFRTPESHLISVVLDRDQLPGDNRADAAITVTQAVPVLLVDGAPQLEPVRSESFFASAALTPPEAKAPWVRATTIRADRLDEQLNNLDAWEAVIFANVPQPTSSQVQALKQYVAAGGGLFIALGDKADAAVYNGLLFEGGRGLLPASLLSIEENPDETQRSVRASDTSLEVPWMQRFRSEHEGGFTDARFSHWWKVRPAREVEDRSRVKGRGSRVESQSSGPGPSTLDSRPSVVAARLNTGDPLIVTRPYGRGTVVLLTSAIDADWSTLPAKEDYVPLLHEIVFLLASNHSARNVETGSPLMLLAREQLDVKDYAFFGPDGTALPPTPGGFLRDRQVVRLTDTTLPGVYRFQRRGSDDKPASTPPPEYFVVNFDRGESDLTPLDEAQLETLAGEDAARMTFVQSTDSDTSLAELKEAMFKDDSRAEFWHVLLLVFLGLLVVEVVMTRRLVQGGHAEIEEREPEVDRVRG